MFCSVVMEDISVFLYFVDPEVKPWSGLCICSVLFLNEVFRRTGDCFSLSSVKPFNNADRQYERRRRRNLACLLSKVCLFSGNYPKSIIFHHTFMKNYISAVQCLRSLSHVGHFFTFLLSLWFMPSVSSAFGSLFGCFVSDNTKKWTETEPS